MVPLLELFIETLEPKLVEKECGEGVSRVREINREETADKADDWKELLRIIKKRQAGRLQRSFRQSQEADELEEAVIGAACSEERRNRARQKLKGSGEMKSYC